MSTRLRTEASKGIMTAEQADSVAKKIQTEGVEKLSDELLTQEEEAIRRFDLSAILTLVCPGCVCVCAPCSHRDSFEL